MAARRPPVLLGRAGERQALDRLLANVRGGQSAVLVVRGEAGVGETALLHYCARQASGFQVARIAGVESEMELPFAGLHQLCAPMLGRLGALPEPQQAALGIALRWSTGPSPTTAAPARWSTTWSPGAGRRCPSKRASPSTCVATAAGSPPCASTTTPPVGKRADLPHIRRPARAGRRGGTPASG